MHKPLTEAEIQFMESFYTPYELIENLIPENIDAPALWSVDSKGLKVWPFQYAMLPYDSMYADDFNLTDKENFQSKINAGTLINISARAIGKSYTMDASSTLAPVYYPGDESCLASFDDNHLNPRKERVANLFEAHPFFQLYHLDGQKKSVNRGSNFRIQVKNGHVIKAANEKVGTPKVGEPFHGIHAKIFSYDEYSYATEKGRLKRVDSGHPFGSMNRYYGIPDVKIGSPLSKILNDEKMRPFVCKLPQSVRPDWNEKTKKEKIDEYNGESSPSYRLNVEAEVIEGASGKFDMKRIRENCYNPEKDIKYFEVNPNNFENFTTELVIDRLPAEQIWTCSDIGTTGSPSEVIIIFTNAKIHKYVYQISLFQLTTQEQAKIFYWLYNKLGTCFISLDCTSDGGRAIADELLILGIPKDKITRCSFNANIVTGFETDKEGKVQLDDSGFPLKKEERQIDWSCQRLEKLFYDGLMEIPNDQKFFKDFSNYFEVMVGNTKRYGTTATDHLLQSFQCFALAQFLNEFETLHNLKRKKRKLGIVK